jgi:DNA-binding beta-propeller fold protein YncE
MKSKCIGLLSALLIIVGAAAGSFASVEWDLEHTLQMDQSPLDVAVSPDGKHIFVLTSSGIFVYSQDGKLEDKIDVGYPVDQMKIGPGGKRLFLTSTKDRTVQILTIDFIVDINVSGSPYKGRQDAPVVIAVFSDFQ